MQIGKLIAAAGFAGLSGFIEGRMKRMGDDFLDDRQSQERFLKNRILALKAVNDAVKAVMKQVDPHPPALDEDAVGQLLESLREDQVKALAEVFDDSQRLAFFTIYQDYRDRWRASQANGAAGSEAAAARESTEDQPSA